jgi:Methyltransferase domain
MVVSAISAPSAWEDIIPRWRKYAPPAKPSAADISRMGLRLNALLCGADGKNSRQAEVLVLGATPELRTLIAGIPSIRVTIIDCVLSMMQAMTALVDADSLNEVWIRGDWLTAPLPSRYFDVVMSDLVLGNLNLEDQHQLISRVRDILKPSGRWISRFDCVDEFSVFEDFSVLLKHYAHLELSPEHLCDLRSVAGLCYWDPATSFLSYAKLGEAMGRYRRGERFIHPDRRVNSILAGLWELTVPFGRPYWLRYKCQLDATLGSHFRWVSAERDDFPYEYPGRGYYIYDLSPG